MWYKDLNSESKVRVASFFVSLLVRMWLQETVHQTSDKKHFRPTFFIFAFKTNKKSQTKNICAEWTDRKQFPHMLAANEKLNIFKLFPKINTQQNLNGKTSNN